MYTMYIINYNLSVKYEIIIWNWKAQRYLLEFALSRRHYSFGKCAIHKPISDRVSKLLLKIVQTDCQ